MSKNDFDKETEFSFNEVARRLLNDIPDNYLLKINVKTDKLLKNGKLDREHVIYTLTSVIQKLMPIILIEKNNSFSLEELGNAHKPLFDYKDSFHHYGEYGKRLKLLLNSAEGINYLKSTFLDELQALPIGFIMNGDASGKLVEIDSECFYPSTSESLRELAIIEQLKRAVRTKIKKNQLRNQKNPFLAIQLFDPMLFRDYTTENTLDMEQQIKVCKTIRDLFIETQNRTLLGVLLYEDCLCKSLFVKNPNLNINEGILELVKSLKNINCSLHKGMITTTILPLIGL